MLRKLIRQALSPVSGTDRLGQVVESGIFFPRQIRMWATSASCVESVGGDLSFLACLQQWDLPGSFKISVCGPPKKCFLWINLPASM